MELEQYRKDGSTIWTEILASFILTAESGEQAIKAVSEMETKIDLVTLDMIMPEPFNMAELSQKVRKILDVA